MKQLLAAIVLLFAFAFPSFAQTGCDGIKVDGIPESVVIDLKKKCTELAKPSMTIDDMSEYAELGKKYGIALSEVAKSIGTTVNELAQTPVGKFMLVMVAYQIMGDDLIGIAGGVTWFVIMIPLWIYFFHRFIFKNVKTRTYTKDGSTVFEKEPVDFNGIAGFMSFWFVIILILICAAGFIMIFS